MNLKTLGLTTSFALMLAACAPGPMAQTGTVVGAVAGGVVGSQIGGGPLERVGAGLAGAAIGGFIGNAIGAKLDENSQRMAYQAQNSALETGQSGRTYGWRNPDNGNYGQVAPQPVQYRGTMPCRSYTHTIYIGGRPEVARGTACRNNDGTWRVVS